MALMDAVELQDRMDALWYLFSHGLVPIIVIVGVIMWLTFVYITFCHQPIRHPHRNRNKK